jgi:hypothetical protein
MGDLVHPAPKVAPTSNTKMFQYPAKKGPYRITLANGYH